MVDANLITAKNDALSAISDFNKYNHENPNWYKGFADDKLDDLYQRIKDAPTVERVNKIMSSTIKEGGIDE